MPKQAKNSLHRLLVTTGLALVTLVLLLSWSAAQGADTQALTLEPETRPAGAWRDFGVAWASMTPTTTTVTSAGKIWEISTQDVTITFYLNSIGEKATAVFTFTPLSGYTLPPPLRGSYFFQLEGRYEWGGTVSIKDPYDITLQYQVSDLNGAQENSLQFYYQEIIGYPPTTRWLPQTGTANPTQNIVQCSTEELGLFGLGGYAFQTYLPRISKNYGG